MDLKVEMIKENEDGSAEVNIHMDDEAVRYLLNKAIIDCLKEAVAHGKAVTP